MAKISPPRTPADSRFPEAPAIASQAWEILSGICVPVDRIQVLKESGKAQVCRLLVATFDGRSVIAKGHFQRTVEPMILEWVSENLTVSVMHHFGSVNLEGMTWSFLEDGGSESFSREHADHVAAFTRWLALLHSSVPKRGRGGLPSRGLAHYQEHLNHTRSVLATAETNPSAGERQTGVFDRSHRVLRQVEKQWDALCELTASWPDSLVHGDLQSKNVLMQPQPDGYAPFVLDWEMAGWGNPAVDLAGLDRMTQGKHRALETYWSARFEPDADRAILPVITAVGHILRSLAAMDWASRSLRYQRWGEKPFRRLIIYSGEIEHYLGQLGISSAAEGDDQGR